jgi:steroid delta-isomerase-like uncharacterized protein
VAELDDNKALVRRFIGEIFERGNEAAVDELAAEEFELHALPSSGDGREDMRRAIERVHGGLADVEFTIEDMVAEGNRVAVRLRSSATHTGTFMGMPATGKHYSIEEIHLFRIDDGKVAEHWHQMDQMGLMKQLGAAPGS